MRNLRIAGCGSGFTLTELLVALSVGMLVLMGVHRIFVAGLTTQNTTSLQAEVNRKAQVGLDSMISKLRGGWGINEDSSASRIWFVDQDENNSRFWLNNGIVYRYCGTSSGSYSGGERLVTDVKQLSFEYLDRNGQPVTAEGAYSVVVLLEVERARHSARLRSAVRLRNK